MLLVKTKIGTSTIHGIGLFAEEDIVKDTIVWEYNALIDKSINIEEIKNLPLLAQEFVNKHGFFDKGKYILCGDYAMFTNHSKNPNLGSTIDLSFAARDIKKGEEITDDYTTYDEDPNSKSLL